MPTAPLRPCATPGCPNRVAAGRCQRCRARRPKRTGWSQLYGPDWPRIRLDYLERHPRCALCPRQATIPDHYPAGIRRLREMGVTNPHHDRYLRPLCGPCHSRETGRHQPGGWNAQRL